ncbi:MAG: HDOD domain-containing protein [Planctomycetes bacterium]|nr:HDOD domain-containing protein [Planctomycetota bacterium]
MNPEVLAAIESTQSIPAAPQVVVRLLELTYDPNFKAPDVVRLMSSDPGIATDVLRIANSALFGARHHIESLQDAIVRLGIRKIRSLIIGRAMIENYRRTRSAVDQSYFWRRSLATAVIASRLADKLQSPQRELAFLGGLLCDIGIVILSHALPEKYKPIAALYAPQKSGLFVEQERSAVDVTHGEVGAKALERWSLPSEIVLAVRRHHDHTFDDLPPPTAALTKTIAAAGEISRVLCEATDPEAAVRTSRSAVSLLRMEPVILGEILPRVETDIAELAATLRIDVIPSRVYRMISEGIAGKIAATPV